MNPTTDTSAFDAQLDEWLAGAEDELFEPPTDIERADRVALALARVDADIDAVEAAVKARADRLAAWRTGQLDQLGARRTHLEGLLEGWARAVHKDDPRRKSWRLPCGLTPKLRARRMRAAVAQGADIIETIAVLLPEAVKVTKSVLVSEVKDRATPGAELTDPGIEVPEGYIAHEAMVTIGGELHPVDGLVLLMPAANSDEFSVGRPTQKGRP